MPHIEDALLYSLAQEGDVYEFGAKAKASNPDPTKLDCSGLVKWSCDRAGIPGCPHGADAQRMWCKNAGLLIPVGKAITTRGALLFVGDKTGTGRDRTTHVAWSLGDGTTIEARGVKWGIGVWPSSNRFDFAGLIPGVDYSPGHGRLDDPAPAPSQEDPMKILSVTDGPEGGKSFLVGEKRHSYIDSVPLFDELVKVYGPAHKVNGVVWAFVKGSGGE